MTDEILLKFVAIGILFFAMCISCVLGTWFAKLAIIDRKESAECPAFFACVIMMFGILHLAGVGVFR